MKYYCPICDKPSWYYSDADPECYCEYCDKTYPSKDFYLDEEETDNRRFRDAVDDWVHEYINEHW